MYAALDLPDYIDAFEFTVNQLTTTQHKRALQLVRMHNAQGHMSKQHLRWTLQQSEKKSDRELAKYVDLMPICNHCIQGNSKENGTNKESSGCTDLSLIKFMSHISLDCSGIQMIATALGYLYFMLIVCRKTSFAWVYLLRSPTEAARIFERFLREVTQQHLKKTVKRLRSDYGPSDFGNLNFTNLLHKYDI